LKHRFLEFSQIEFCDVEEAENVFKVTCEPWKRRFLDFTQLEFWAIQEEENSS